VSDWRAAAESERLAAVKGVFADFVRSFNQGDFETAFAGVNEDFEVHLPPGFPEAVVRGRENLIRHYRDLGESLNWEIGIREIVEVTPTRYLIELEGAGEGEASGLSTERRFWSVLVVEDGQPRSLHEFADRDQALAAARTAEQR
jgi:ketosteroid isomerase-like protein